MSASTYFLIVYLVFAVVVYLAAIYIQKDVREQENEIKEAQESSRAKQIIVISSYSKRLEHSQG
jgi:uncharacterized membrane protein